MVPVGKCARPSGELNQTVLSHGDFEPSSADIRRMEDSFSSMSGLKDLDGMLSSTLTRAAARVPVSSRDLDGPLSEYANDPSCPLYSLPSAQALKLLADMQPLITNGSVEGKELSNLWMSVEEVLSENLDCMIMRLEGMEVAMWSSFGEIRSELRALAGAMAASGGYWIEVMQGFTVGVGKVVCMKDSLLSGQLVVCRAKDGETCEVDLRNTAVRRPQGWEAMQAVMGSRWGLVESVGEDDRASYELKTENREKAAACVSRVMELIRRMQLCVHEHLQLRGAALGVGLRSLAGRLRPELVEARGLFTGVWPSAGAKMEEVRSEAGEEAKEQLSWWEAQSKVKKEGTGRCGPSANVEVRLEPWRVARYGGGKRPRNEEGTSAAKDPANLKRQKRLERGVGLGCRHSSHGFAIV